jgi:hypothetical protein
MNFPAVLEVKKYFGKFAKERDKNYDDNGAVFFFAFILCGILGIIAGCAADLNSMQIWHFGGTGWWLVLLAATVISYFIAVYTEDNFPLLGLGFNVFLGAAIGYGIAFLLTYWLCWLLGWLVGLALGLFAKLAI